MGRPKGSGEKKEKKSPVKLSPIPRVHNGKVTEPWRLLEYLVKELVPNKRFAHLKDCRIGLLWMRDAKADADGVMIGAAVCLASELDRILLEEAGADGRDIFIKLPREQWNHLTEDEKTFRTFHELCHIRPKLDANGKQKFDVKDRPLWRLGRHPIAAFPEEVERFGVDRVIDHNGAILKSAETAARPLLAIAEQAEEADAKKPDGWKRLGIVRLDMPPAVEQYVIDAGCKTIGALTKHMGDHGEFWDRDLTVGGQRKPPNFRTKIEDAFSEFWATHPEYTQDG